MSIILRITHTFCYAAGGWLASQTNSNWVQNTALFGATLVALHVWQEYRR